MASPVSNGDSNHLDLGLAPRSRRERGGGDKGHGDTRPQMHVQTRVSLVLVISEVPVAPASIACQMLGPIRPGEWNTPCNNSLRRLLGVSISQECSSLPVGSKSLAKQRGAWDMRSGCDSDALADRCACADVDSWPDTGTQLRLAARGSLIWPALSANRPCLRRRAPGHWHWHARIY
jgi:hypothetical protein